MTGSSVRAIIQALNRAGVRYLVVGGLAVVAHGHVRFTADVDLVLDFDGDNLHHGMDAFAGLGFRPRVPVALHEFADARMRQAWIDDKRMTVFSLSSEDHPLTEVDLFVADPIGFDDAYERRVAMEVAPEVEATFIAVDDLLKMKRAAGRPQDLWTSNGSRSSTEKVTMTERPVDDPVESPWGWEAHQRAQRRRFARVSLADKIAWLEEAHRLVLTLARQRSDQASGATHDRGNG